MGYVFKCKHLTHIINCILKFKLRLITCVWYLLIVPKLGPSYDDCILSSFVLMIKVSLGKAMKVLLVKVEVTIYLSHTAYSIYS